MATDTLSAMTMAMNIDMNAIKVLCAADLHLGRHVTAAGAPELSYTTIAWERLVDHCLRDSVKADLLLLAGDLFDGAGFYIEHFSALKRGIVKLIENNVVVVAIAGNHDAKLLAQFHRSVGLREFHLLGSNNNWERFSTDFRGTRLHIDALSFSQSVMNENPLLSCPKEGVPADELLIGLLHCDVDSSESRYGPVRSGDFYTLPHQVWILGHIHTPRLIHRENPLVHYCGSLQGLDISEVGPHGAWELSLTATTTTSNSIDLAPLRWEKICIDVTELPLEDWQGELLMMLEKHLCQTIVHSQNVDMIGVRLLLTGRTALFKTLQGEFSKLQDQESAGIHLTGEWIPYFLESIENHTLPARNLAKLARGSDLIAALARLLQPYEEGEMLPPAIYEKLTAKLQMEPYLKQCSSAWPSETECRELFLSQGSALLDELLEQHGDSTKFYEH